MIADDLNSLKKANKNHTQHCIKPIKLSKKGGTRLARGHFF